MKIKRKRYEPKTKRYADSFSTAEYAWLEDITRLQAVIGDPIAERLHARVQRRINAYVCSQLEPAAVCVGRVEVAQ